MIIIPTYINFNNRTITFSFKRKLRKDCFMTMDLDLFAKAICRPEINLTDFLIAEAKPFLEAT